MVEEGEKDERQRERERVVIEKRLLTLKRPVQTQPRNNMAGVYPTFPRVPFRPRNRNAFSLYSVFYYVYRRGWSSAAKMATISDIVRVGGILVIYGLLKFLPLVFPKLYSSRCDILPA